MKAYKGFDKNLKCRDFQYEIGGEYTEEEASLCNNGFHACENALDTLRYYHPGESRYCEVELEDNGQRNNGDSKICGKHIKIGAEIGLKGVINAGVKFVFDRCENAVEDRASGESGNAAASGERGNAAASGWMGNAAASGVMGNAAASGWKGNAAASGSLGNAAASGWKGNAAASGWKGNAAVSGLMGNAAASGESGNAAASGLMGNAAASGSMGTAVASGAFGTASADGNQCIAVAWGINSRARGKIGTWIVVTEHDELGNIINAVMEKVDGDTIKADTWYTMRGGKIVEAE